MNKYYIDAGAYTGDTLDLFLSQFPYSDKFKIILFECRPELVLKLKSRVNENITLEDKAIWIYDGETNLYLGDSNLSSSLIQEKANVYNDKSITVKCIDFSRYILDNFSEDDFIVLKLDIEGAEFDVLDKMIEDGSIKYIDELCGELHAGKIQKPLSIEDELAAKLKIYGKEFMRMDDDLKLWPRPAFDIEKDPADDAVLQSITAEIEQLAKDIVKNYKDEPSEMGGSITQVHESSPLIATSEERLLKSNNKIVDDSFS